MQKRGCSIREEERLRKENIVYKGKNRIWVGSIIAALVAAITVFVVMLQMEKNMLLQYEKKGILIAAQEIPKGQLITIDNCGEYFKEMELDHNCIPDTALISLEQVQDMVAVADIEKGVLLTEGMFEEIESITKNMQSPVIAGFRADDLYQVVGGVLRTGDRINIYHMTQDGEVVLNWQDVFVQQVFDNGGVSIANGDKQTAAQRINVYLEQGNVEQFYTELSTGSLRVVKVCD